MRESVDGSLLFCSNATSQKEASYQTLKSCGWSAPWLRHITKNVKSTVSGDGASTHINMRPKAESKMTFVKKNLPTHR